MTKIFSELHHIYIVVRDIDSAVAYYERLGIGPFHDVYSKNSSPYVELQVPNLEGTRGLREKHAQLANFELQLCQPSEHDSPQRRFLDEHGEGVYHIGFESRDLDKAETEADRLGLSVIARGRRADGTGFCYFDTAGEAGVVLEIRKSPEEVG